MRSRRGASAVELLLCSAILAAAFLPIYTLVQSNKKVAYLGEYQVMARRRAYRALACVQGRSYHAIQQAALGGEAPPSDLPRMPPEGHRIAFALGSGERDATIARFQDDLGKGYVNKSKRMQTDLYFTELEPGLGRLAALVRWKDPTSKATKSFVAVRFVQAPFHFWVTR